MRVKSVTALVVALLLLVGLTACSKKDDSSVGTGDQTTTTGAGDAGSGSGSDESLPSSEDLGAVEDMLDGLLGEGCLAASSYYLLTGLAGFAALGGLTEADVAEYEQTLQELSQDLPSDLRDDIEVVSEAYHQYFEAFTGLPEGANLFDPAVSSQLEEAGKVLEAPEFKAANDRITAWLEQNCNGMR